MRRLLRGAARQAAVPAGLLGVLLLAACSTDPGPSATPLPTTFPVAPEEEAVALAQRYAEAWDAGDHETMYLMLSAADRQATTLEAFTELHARLREMAVVEDVRATVETARPVLLPPRPRPPDLPPPSPTPVPTPDPSATSGASPPASSTPQPTPAPSVDPATPLDGPVPGLEVPVELALDSDRFGRLELDRVLTMTQNLDGWAIHWSPATLFPELGPGGTLRLDRSLGRRGEIASVDGTLFATTDDEGRRIYPQEWLAGQTIGHVSEVTAEDLASLSERGYRAGDIVGRSGLEFGAEELLRGTPGWTLSAVDAAGLATELFSTPAVPGANLVITIRADLQRSAEAALAPYGEAATAAVDPTTGDVWALASMPAFNPNAATLGTTLAGAELSPPSFAALLNPAVLAAYPAGSSFKPFTLAAALQAGVVTPASRVTCPPTWDFSGFTFRNYEEHQLPGQVSLAEAMAFSCNTTYMPLSYRLYQADPTALTELLAEFGFGQATGITYLVEETGILPDDAWLAENRNASYGPFDQIQLSIGQGAFLGTPLQLANAYAAIGNGGTLWQPRILVSATLPDGTPVLETQPTVARQISMTAADLAYVTDTMQAVVTLPYGTGTAAFAGFGIPVAGKSGTAETGGPNPHAWFPAYAPADDPGISVATVLPHIRLGTGGTDAAPLVRRVMATYFASAN